LHSLPLRRVLSCAPVAYTGRAVWDHEARWSGIVATGVFIAVVSTAVVSIIAEARGCIADIDGRSAPLLANCRTFRDQVSATAIEYGLIATLISVVMIIAVTGEARVGNDEPTPTQIGSGWCVQITLPYVHQPQTPRIKTEEAAREGIARKSAKWLNGTKFYAPSSVSNSPHACVATQHLLLSRRVPQIRGWPSGH
jgi:hypothetical protein